MDFDAQELIIVGAVVGVVVVLAVLLIVAMVRRRSARRDHTEALRRQFGDDYDATVARLGRKQGEAELDERMHRFREMELERVSPDSRDELTERWKVVQYRFLEDPAYSVRESEHLISALMRERGFPDGGFETRARALSMAHAELADPYREAYATFRATEDGSVTVGEMFDAMHGIGVCSNRSSSDPNVRPESKDRRPVVRTRTARTRRDIGSRRPRRRPAGRPTRRAQREMMTARERRLWVPELLRH